MAKARAGHLPTLDLVAQVQRSRSENFNSPQSGYVNSSVGLQLNVPLYQGGYVDSVSRQVQAEYLRAGELMEALRLRVKDIDFSTGTITIRAGKGKKDRYVPLSEHLIRGLKKYILAEQPKDWLFNGQPLAGRAGGDFDSRYSQRGVQWVIKQASKQAGIQKEVHVHSLRHTFATHLLEDGVDIVTLKHLLGHENIETTLLYLQIAQLQTQKVFSPLDTLFAQCSRSMK
jgi:integrase